VNSVVVPNPKHSTIWVSVKKVNSITARPSTVINNEKANGHERAGTHRHAGGVNRK